MSLGRSKDVIKWKSGQRVAVGWYGGHCGHCESCRRGDFLMCKYAVVSGISYDGGYSDYMIAPTVALVEILRIFHILMLHRSCALVLPHTILLGIVEHVLMMS
jgi:D-arabinose 1-dehydrogenase-like Zn-dependent alcohol dehydrogenase